MADRPSPPRVPKCMAPSDQRKRRPASPPEQQRPAKLNRSSSSQVTGPRDDDQHYDADVLSTADPRRSDEAGRRNAVRANAIAAREHAIRCTHRVAVASIMLDQASDVVERAEKACEAAAPYGIHANYALTTKSHLDKSRKKLEQRKAEMSRTETECKHAAKRDIELVEQMMTSLVTHEQLQVVLDQRFQAQGDHAHGDIALLEKQVEQLTAEAKNISSQSSTNAREALLQKETLSMQWHDQQRRIQQLESQNESLHKKLDTLQLPDVHLAQRLEKLEALMQVRTTNEHDTAHKRPLEEDEQADTTSQKCLQRDDLDSSQTHGLYTPFNSPGASNDSAALLCTGSGSDQRQIKHIEANLDTIRTDIGHLGAELRLALTLKDDYVVLKEQFAAYAKSDRTVEPRDSRLNLPPNDQSSHESRVSDAAVTIDFLKLLRPQWESMGKLDQRLVDMERNVKNLQLHVGNLLTAQSPYNPHVNSVVQQILYTGPVDAQGRQVQVGPRMRTGPYQPQKHVHAARMQQIQQLSQANITMRNVSHDGMTHSTSPVERAPAQPPASSHAQRQSSGTTENELHLSEE